MAEKLDLSIEGMHCNGCVNRVTEALKKLPGVAVEAVKVGSARVGFDPALANEATIIEAINGLGFQAQEARSWLGKVFGRSAGN
jgi:copper chaperone